MGKPNILFKRPDHSNRSSNNENIILLHPKLLVIWALKGVELTKVEHSILAEVQKSNHSRDFKEPVAKAALKLQWSSSKTVHSLEWLNINSLLHFRKKIYVLQTPDLYKRIVILCYYMKITGHPGW